MGTPNLAVYSKNSKSETELVHLLRTAVGSAAEVQILPAGEISPEMTQPVLLLVDGRRGFLHPILEELAKKSPEPRPAIVLILDEKDSLPGVVTAGSVDEVIVLPFRKLDVLSKLQHSERMTLVSQLSKMSSSFSETIKKLELDLDLVEKLQKSKLPDRFPNIKGFRFLSRYLAGSRSGGDYFDLAESRDHAQLSVVLSDSSSYKLSGAMVTILTQTINKFSKSKLHELLKLIHKEALPLFKEKDQLSLFYGTLIKKTQEFHFLNLGLNAVFFAPPHAPFAEVASGLGPLTHSSDLGHFKEEYLTLVPESRLAILSHGFIEGVGGATEALAVLNRFRNDEIVDSLNEFAFAIKRTLVEPDAMPKRDCTAVICDVDSQVVRLLKSKKTSPKV